VALYVGNSVRMDRTCIHAYAVCAVVVEVDQSLFV
jgi:hypothetical protein